MLITNANLITWGETPQIVAGQALRLEGDRIAEMGPSAVLEAAWPREERLDAHAAQLSRAKSVDWNALLGLMSIAADNEANPFMEAVRIQERLFTTKPIALGIEESIKHPNVPCNLHTDAERARQVGSAHGLHWLGYAFAKHISGPRFDKAAGVPDHPFRGRRAIGGHCGARGIRAGT